MQTVNDFLETDLGNISPNPRGEYSPDAAYEYLDLVNYRGGSYLCVAELGSTITGTAPEPGKNTAQWQLLTLPGDLTPDYIAMHDRVANLAEQVDGNAEEVRVNTESVTAMESNVRQLQEQVTDAAEAADQSKDSAAGYAQSADQSRQTAQTAAQDVAAQVTGFDAHVADKTEEAENDIAAARKTAVGAITKQQDISVQTVKDQTADYIAFAEKDAKDEIQKVADQYTVDVNEAVKTVTDEGTKQVQAVADKGAEQIETVNAEGATQTKAVNDAGTTQTQAVNTAGATQEKAIKDAGTTQVNDINTAGATQKKAVEDAGIEKVEAIGKAGTEQVNAVNTAGTSQVSAVNAAGTNQVSQILETGSEELAALNAAGGSLENAITRYYAMRRTGKVYRVRMPKFEHNPTSECEKLLDNAGLAYEPSTDTVEGADDYLSGNHPMYEWVHVNYIRDDYGDPHPTYIEGMDGYKTTGAVDVGSMQMNFYWNVEEYDEYVDVTWSDLPNDTYGLVPYWTNGDGTVPGYIIHSSYASGIALDGLLRSQPGIVVELYQSYNNMITNYGKKGAGYKGAGNERNTFAYLFFIMKAGSKNLQTKMQGCTNYSCQYAASIIRDTEETYFPLTTAQASNIITGSRVYVGYYGVSSGALTTDRGCANMRAYADMAQVIKKEPIDDNNVAIYLDVAKGFTTTPVAVSDTLTSNVYLSTMPWHAGTTDAVIGRHDGSMVSNTNGRYPCRIQGLEILIGAYFVGSDMVLDFQPDYSKKVYCAKKGTAHSSSGSVIRNTYKYVGTIPAEAGGNDFWVGDIGIDMETKCTWPKTIGSSSAQGTGDICYAGGANTSGMREDLKGGDLWAGSHAGPTCLYCGVGPGWGWWACAGWD